MTSPVQSYIIACTPRSGSHLLADGLVQTGIAGNPDECFPRPSEHTKHSITAPKGALLTQPPPDTSYDDKLDADYVREVLTLGITPNGVFGTKIHYFQFNDAVRRVKSYLGINEGSEHEVLSQAFPNLSYIWLRRRDKIAQAVSWHRAVQSNQYIKTHQQKEDNSPGRKVEFDHTAIRIYWSALRSADASWQHYFSTLGEQPYSVWYEDLAADYAGSIQGILRFLKLNSQLHRPIVPRHKKASDTQSLEWVERFKRNLPHTAR